ncbi:flagellar hook-length control protein FliK [Marinobacteraceae bacterium S3BR75-40.1]
MPAPILMPEAFAASKGSSAKRAAEPRGDDGAFEQARRNAEQSARSERQERSRDRDKVERSDSSQQTQETQHDRRKTEASDRSKESQQARDKSDKASDEVAEGKDGETGDRVQEGKQGKNDDNDKDDNKGAVALINIQDNARQVSGRALPLEKPVQIQPGDIKRMVADASGKGAVQSAVTAEVTGEGRANSASLPGGGLPGQGAAKVQPQASQDGMDLNSKLMKGDNNAPLEKIELARLAAMEGREGGGDKASAARFSLHDSTLSGLSQQIHARGSEVREQPMPLLKQYTTSIDVPVSQAQWGDKVAGKIAWLANQGIQSAEIHINPPELGPMEVKVKVHNDQASVVMHAHSPTVRDMLETHGHRLRDMLQDGGLNLAQMDVSDQSAQQEQASEDQAGQEGSGSFGGSSGNSLVSTETGESVQTGELHLRLKGEVDLYA